MQRIVTLSLALVGMFLLGACSERTDQAREITITFVGINDIHGQLVATEERGSFVDLSAYVKALRAARAADGGAVVVLDAGDMWQGTLASNLDEGASMIKAYNALGVAAAAIGNHEFDFGPVGSAAIPMEAGHDPRGALKQRAREAQFPLLAANLIDLATDEPVDWENVQPSVMLDVDGVKVGVIGVLAANGLAQTIAANTVGLRLAPLAETIASEARSLRDEGASLVFVIAHAGGVCTDASDPHDHAACNPLSELFQVAYGLDVGLVDHIFGGHLDFEMAHVVNDISISMNLKSARSFGRVDFRVNASTGEVLDRTIFPPQQNTLPRPATYEGQALETVARVAGVASAALAAADDLQAQELGVLLEAPFPLGDDMESALFNLVTEALLDSFDVDVVIHNVRGGLRKGLPAGPLTYGSVYEMSPFDNYITIIELTGSDMRRIVETQLQRPMRAGFAGMRVFVTCNDDAMNVRLVRDDDSEIADDDQVRLLANDYLALGGDRILTPVIPESGFQLLFDQPRTREALVDWFRARGGSLDPAEWRSHDRPEWNLPTGEAASCLN